MKIQSLTGAWQFRQAGTQEWLPASVPGGVHTDLLALGRIPDPFVGDNERRVGWVAEADWEYRYSFQASPELLNLTHIELLCDGLDTLATVRLNGQLLGHAANMFRQYRWQVKPHLQPGENELLIHFASPVQFAIQQQARRPMMGVSQAIPGGPHLRKAPCQFGWDWGPQLPPVGIWKDIRLEGYELARLAEVHLLQRHEGVRIEVQALIEVEGMQAGLAARMQIEAPDGRMMIATQKISSKGENKLAIAIDDPQLWWPNGLGKQPLYRVRVELLCEDQILDAKDFQLGLRTIELLQQPDDWGRSFTFVVNGQPIFAKGANWIPADSFPTRISDSQLEDLIRAAAQTHQNMLRVWGGGFYEEERFYDLCDRYGILVWQDFIFSCSIYPLDEPDFLENVRLEVLENVRRLRHRASLALWCGNNEMEQGWAEWGWGSMLDFQELKAAYQRFFHQTLPQWCTTEDPDHAYWPSSPSSDTPFENPNGQMQGDAHYWDVWHGRKPFTAYRNQFPRFMSEFGFQALPPLETIRTYAEEAEWNMTSYIMEQHQKNASGNALMVAQMLETFRLPKDFDSLVYLSLVLQAEGIRYGVEHWRRYPQQTSGTLYWQLNDCWPVASWSSLDYFGRWKALHYAARRFYAPLLLSIEDTPTKQRVFVTNDSTAAWEGTVRWSLETLDGRALDGGEQAVKAGPFEVLPVASLDFSSRLDDDLRRELVFVAELWQGEQLLARQAAYFAPTKHLKLVEPQITAQLQIEEGVVTIELTSSSLARLIELSLAGADVVFSDNYFDLPANRPVVVTAPLPEGWTLYQSQAAFHVRSIYNSYAHSAGD